MFILQRSKSASSREQIKIKGVNGDILILPNDKYRGVLEISPINLELKSEAEQDLIIDNYQAFLNSLPCPIQILFRVREVDLDGYLESLNQRLSGGGVIYQKNQMKEYSKFVKRLVKDNKILSRSFYIVLSSSDQEKLEPIMIGQQLKLLEDIIHKGLEKLNIQTRRLSGLELFDLFYSFYNPEKSKYQSITDQTLKLMESSYL